MRLAWWSVSQAPRAAVPCPLCQHSWQLHLFAVRACVRFAEDVETFQAHGVTWAVCRSVTSSIPHRTISPTPLTARRSYTVSHPQVMTRLLAELCQSAHLGHEELQASHTQQSIQEALPSIPAHPDGAEYLGGSFSPFFWGGGPCSARESCMQHASSPHRHENHRGSTRSGRPTDTADTLGRCRMFGQSSCKYCRCQCIMHPAKQLGRPLGAQRWTGQWPAAAWPAVHDSRCWSPAWSVGSCCHVSSALVLHDKLGWVLGLRQLHLTQAACPQC